jgi:peptide/nickel transport system permease protein
VASRILARLLQLVPTLVLLTLLIFVLVRLLPGDPAAALLGNRATPALLARMHAQMGLDKPVWQQFLIFCGNVLQGDFGISTSRRVPVMQLILQRTPVTVAMTALAALISLLLAVPLAFLAAMRRGRLEDVAVRGAFQVGLSTPIFYLGLLMLGFFGARLHWFPVGGLGTGFWGVLYHLLLPALSLALSLSAILLRNLRAAVIEVLGADYVDFAHAKGLSPWRVMNFHVLRNAMMSTVALLGLNAGVLLGNAVVTENVFAIPGLGSMMVESIFARDYPVVQALTLVIAVLVSVTFLLTDIVEAWLDPRATA